MNQDEERKAKFFIRRLNLSILISALINDGVNLWMFGINYIPNSNLDLAYFENEKQEWKIKRRDFFKMIADEIDERESRWNKFL